MSEETLCVCAEPLERRGVYPCGHALCFACTLKHRVKMKDSACPYCRQAADTVRMVAGDGDPADVRIPFTPGGLLVQSQGVAKLLRHILAPTCPLCDTELASYKALREHLQAQHERVLCDLCTKHELVFSSEFAPLKPGEIKQHLASRHVRCKYCKKYFYGTVEFAKHCKEVHIACPICERRDPEHPQYFQNYAKLADHYREQHYMCMVDTCLDDKHIVFETRLELQNHMAEQHRLLFANQEVNVQELRPAEAAPAPSTHAEPSALERYATRLSLVAGHDADKVAKIEGANATFLAHKVPAEIFIATYEQVLGAPRAQITALLAAFKRARAADLPADLERTLAFTLVQREAADAPQAKPSAPAAAPGRQPRPTPIARNNWAGALDARVRGFSLEDLPQLGGGKPPARSAQAWRPPAPGPPRVRPQDLPQLKPTKPASKTWAAAPGLGPGLVTRAPRSASPSPGVQSTPGSHSASTTSLAASASSSSHSASSASLSKPRASFENLPALPGRAKSDPKKRTHNVLRIV